MSKRSVLAIVVALAAIATAVSVFVLIRSGGQAAPAGSTGSTGSTGSAGSTNLTVRIDGEAFTLVDGSARNEGPPGSATANTVRVIGEPVAGDVNGDGRADSALTILNDPGGSGTFYYAVVAVDDDGGYRATNVVPLGDRIEPQRIVFADGRFVYEYLTRRPGEPLSAPATVPARTVVSYDQQSGEISAQP